MRLTVTSHLTLDGVVQSNGKPEPELGDGFEQGGWQLPYLDREFAALMAESIGPAEAFLFGRRTYELFEGHWPYVKDPRDPLATKLNGCPKYVVSSTLENPHWDKTAVLRGDPATEIDRLKKRPGGELQVHGSATLIRRLMHHGLVDEYRLFVHPVVLGDGHRLFEPGTAPLALRLVSMRTTRLGVVMHVYEPAGKPEYGAVAAGQRV